MKIVFIAAGAGMMYCGACARDLTLIRELMARGHDVEVYPLYSPLRLDGGDTVPMRDMAFGGINVYLQQLSTIFARLPRTIRRWLDHPTLLNMVAGFAIKTKPADLGPLTVSMLAGQDGQQRTELDQLVALIAVGEHPDVVMITNSMLSGIAPALKARLAVPVVCTVQGEDLFINGLREPYREHAQQLMRAHAAAVDLYLAPGVAYAQHMSEFLAIADEKMRVARAGIDLTAYHPQETPPPLSFTIGYVSVIIPGKGLDLLLEALQLLRKQHRDVRLQIAGKVLNNAYWATLQQTIAQTGLSDYVTILGEVDFNAKLALLHNCSVFCVPSRVAESRGFAMLEAMACGIPTLIPDTGIFPEIHTLTSAGEPFSSGDPSSLAAACTRVIDAPQQAQQTAQNALPALATHFSAQRMTDDVLAAYNQVIIQHHTNLSI